MPDVRLIGPTGDLIASVAIPARNPPPPLLSWRGSMFMQRTFSVYQIADVFEVAEAAEVPRSGWS